MEKKDENKESEEEDPVENVKLALSKMQKYHEELENQIETIYKNSGLDRKQLQEYLKDERNFSKVEWERLQETRKHYDKLLEKQLPEAYKKKKKDEKIIKKQKKMRGRSLGSRKKWLKMD